MSLTSPPRGRLLMQRDGGRPRLQRDDQQHNLQSKQQQLWLQRESREQQSQSQGSHYLQSKHQQLPLQRENREQQSQSHGSRYLQSSQQQLAFQTEPQSEIHHSSDRQQQASQHRPKLRIQPLRQSTHLAWWFAGSCCILMWIIIILGGVLVLIIYLVFRPKSPLLDIQSATLNAAYLDTGTLLNADITILANFSNPNRKVDVAFSYVQVDLYFMGTMIATQAVEPFAERRRQSALKNLHMVASEVALPQEAAKDWLRGTTEEGVALELAGRFRTRSDLGKWLHFTYWLHGRCTIVIGAPPSGVLLSSRCRTKR